MDFYSSIEQAIDELKKNKYGIIIKKTKKNMLITISIKFPKEILNQEISQISIEFLLIMDFYKPKFIPKLYCLSPYCYPHFADGRDIFRELPSSKNPKKGFNFSNILSEILEFIKANFQKGGLYFFGKYYLGSRYDLRMLQKACSNKNIFNVKENLVLNGKSIKLNRLVILSDVYFLMFEQEKWYKNNLVLTFWSSISNIQKIQKVKDSKTLILQWTQKEKEDYAMSLTVNQRENFINIILDKMRQFGMNYDVKKFEEDREMVEKIGKKRSIDLESQNQNLLDNNEKEEENEDYDEEEEEEEDDNEEDNNIENKDDKDEEDDNINNDKNEEEKNNENTNKEDVNNPITKEEQKIDNKEENGKNILDIKQDINILNNIKKENEQKIAKEEKIEEKKEEIKQEIKEETKEEKIEKIKEEIKEEGKDEIKEEAKEEIKEEAKEEIKEEKKEEIQEKETEKKEESVDK